MEILIKALAVLSFVAAATRMSVTQGQTLDASCHHLNLGLGVARCDRDAAIRSAYRFNGYTILIVARMGQERHFVALNQGQTPSQPQEIIGNGQMPRLRENRK